jgi:imidazolonepropionase-like amidohydrolase
MAVAYGLDHDAALRSITLSAAELLGVGDRLGSIEKGKDATLIVTTGDPLEMATQVELAYIDGRRIDLSNKQTDLAKKYREKYRQLGLTPGDN